MKRREFLQYGTGAIGTLIVGSQLSWLLSACGGGGGGGGTGGSGSGGGVQVESIRFRITDAVKEMVTHNSINAATCYFWIYKDDRFPSDCPGPNIFTTEGERIEIELTNELDENHAFFIPGVVDSGPIAPGATRKIAFTAPAGGTYLYYDNLNAPVNRVMGLHGAFVVMPKSASGFFNKITPYSNPTDAVQRLYNDFGSSDHWPGLAWHEGDPLTDTPPFRQYIWITSEASPLLFDEVGNHTPGLDFSAAAFVNRFLHDPYADTFNTGVFNRKAHFFTLSGQSGHFSHHNPYVSPYGRVGEPALIRILGAGLWEHSMHIHANHVFVTSVNGTVQENPLWVDTYTLRPLWTVDYTVPFMRPPDIPNVRGIGRADAPLAVASAPLQGGWGAGGGDTVGGVSTWPPLQELDMRIPKVGRFAGTTPLDVQLSPMCYPMHSHSEASQGAQGGNYNCGLISGINFTGDRNTPGGVTTFPNRPSAKGPRTSGPPADDSGHSG